MKIILTLLLSFITVFSFEQNYSFAKNFINGTIILKDSTEKTGLIKWFPSQNERLKFKESENDDVKKYAPEDLTGFVVDTMKFYSVFNFNAYGALGITVNIKHDFAQLIDSGKFNIYLVFIASPNVLSGNAETDVNFLFERKNISGIEYAAFPFAMRMKEKKYEDAKANLYVFFKDYPSIIEKIKDYRQQDDFFDIIDLMKTLN